MLHHLKARAIGVGTLLAAGATWPTLLCAVTDALRSPYERALQLAWCGGAPQAGSEFLGHCVACWSGALAFVLAAVLIALAEPTEAASMRQ